MSEENINLLAAVRSQVNMRIQSISATIKRVRLVVLRETHGEVSDSGE